MYNNVRTHTQSDKHTETAETLLKKAGAVKFDHSISQGPGIASGRVPDFRSKGPRNDGRIFFSRVNFLC